MSKTSRQTIYVQVAPHRLTLRNVRTGASVTTSPEVALPRGAQAKLLAFGAKARKQESRSVQVLNPFAHPRTLLADPAPARMLMQVLMKQVHKRSLFGGAPGVVMHLQDDPAGGFTQLEIRGFQELGASAGAARVVVWQGPNLTDEQLLAGQFPKEGRVLS